MARRPSRTWPRPIGFSKAYIYKFFDSKQAIGEAICAQCLEKIMFDRRRPGRRRGTNADREVSQSFSMRL
jgi:AcrR family transcriptional regulator